ncbi:MAG TPA: hypothetical protein EYP20_04005 [Aigarchaeota archaeon]|nr:hypothetical protein [Aigarchaeota archaeon]
MRFELRTAEDRRRAFRELARLALQDLARGRVPTFHVVHVEGDGAADSHYMTPISLEPVDGEGSVAAFAQDLLFFLRLLLRLRRVVEAEYDPERPAIVFTYLEQP